MKEFIVDSVKFTGFIKLVDYDHKFPDDFFKEIEKSTKPEIPIEIPLETFFKDISINEEN